MGIPHSPNLINPIKKFWEIPDHITQIINQILILLGTHRVLKPTTVVVHREMFLEVDNCPEDTNRTISTRIMVMQGPFVGKY